MLRCRFELRFGTACEKDLSDFLKPIDSKKEVLQIVVIPVQVLLLLLLLLLLFSFGANTSVVKLQHAGSCDQTAWAAEQRNCEAVLKTGNGLG